MNPEKLVERISRGWVMSECSSFDAWYSLDDQTWSKIRPNVKACKVRYEHYFVVDGKKYKNIDAATNADIYNRILPFLPEILASIADTINEDI